MHVILRWTARLLVALAALLATLAAAAALFLAFDRPTPIHELLSDRAEPVLSAWDGSDPPEAGATSVLVLGTPHLAQRDDVPDPTALRRIVNALAAFDPDLVAVEYLPPDWPVDEGRDYRPGFDLARYAEAWDLSRATSPPRTSCGPATGASGPPTTSASSPGGSAYGATNSPASQARWRARRASRR
ncbi:MAG: hypothetical protein WD336_09430 [Trueperaceae bacterium]